MDRFIDLTTKLLPVLVAVIGGLWGLYTYIDHAKEAREKELLTRRLEAQKPFLDKQLALYSGEAITH